MLLVVSFGDLVELKKRMDTLEYVHPFFYYEDEKTLSVYVVDGGFSYSSTLSKGEGFDVTNFKLEYLGVGAIQLLEPVSVERKLRVVVE